MTACMYMVNSWKEKKKNRLRPPHTHTFGTAGAEEREQSRLKKNLVSINLYKNAPRVKTEVDVQHENID